MEIRDNSQKAYYIEKKHCISIGEKKGYYIYIKHIESDLNIVIQDFKIYNPVREEICVNGLKNNEDIIKIKFGDCIVIRSIQIIFHRDHFTIIGKEDEYECNMPQCENINKKFDDFPLYKRSPRIIKRVPTDEVQIIMPPEELKNKKGYLAKILVPPLVMLILTGVVCMVNPRGIYVIVTIAGTIVSTIFSVTSYFEEKKEIVRKNQNRKEVYNKYLLNIRKKLNILRKKQIEAMEYNNPNVENIYRLIDNYSSRIYERNSNEDDFLNICIGKSVAKSTYAIKMQNSELEFQKDELVQNAKEVYDEFIGIDNMPVTVELKKSHLGMVGDKKNIHEQLKLIFAQLAFAHSYHDLEIVFIYDSKYSEDFSFLKWYPHFKIKAVNITGLVNNERVRDQVLGSLNQILKERKIKKDEKLKESGFLPHFVFVIESPELISNHSIMEYMKEELLELSASIIYTSNMKANLPESIKTIFVINDSMSGTLLLKEGKEVNKEITLYHIENIDMESMARNLAAIIHEKGMTSKIPQNITFFEMYRVKTVEELNIKNRWKSNSSHKSLAVPLGVRAQNDYVELNLHEKAHGPHGLVAGTTGSGKSEIIQSYILSLAVNFHPYEVGFLLIDYKGGGMAGLFKKLPHLLGTITNLDGSESMRAMASIKSELSRRQYIFSENNVNHINQYNKLFRNGEVSEPIPHLFIISDEFAELKKEQPEFMSELVSAARIGRSLGIHLILATQKPTGVVDDQIWSNSKFKLALKVQNESDSNEVLKTPDAASITLPGRAYLQVGNNEIYELFQSAWSGAIYNGNTKKATVDKRVYLINELGQRKLLNKDLSEENIESSSNKTELDVVVDYVKDVFEDMHIDCVKKPWLDPLGNYIVTPYITNEVVNDLNTLEEVDTDISIGLVDVPEKQMQCEYKLNLLKDGNIAVFSSAGFGKSSTLMTIAMSMAIKNAPKLLNYYILDFGNSSLIQLKNLPHTVDYLTFDDTDKINKLIVILQSEIKLRRKLFGQRSALNLSMYNNLSEKKLPVIVIFIDNYDAIKEIGYDMEDFITKLSRDGISLGIYLVISASRANSVKYAVLNNFKNKFTHYMFDYTEITSIVGRSKYILGEIPGRALVKFDGVNIMQVYRCVEAKDDMEYTQKISQCIEDMRSKYTGPKLVSIPVLPEILPEDKINDFMTESINNDLVPIGLDVENVQVQFLDVSVGNNIIVGAAQSGKTNIIKVILKYVSNTAEKVYLFDSSELELLESARENKVIKYIESVEQAQEFLNNLWQEIENRKDKFEKAREEDNILVPKKFFATISPIYIIIDDCDKFIEMMKTAKGNEAEKIILNATNVGIRIIGTTIPSKLRGFDGITKMFKECTNGIILGNPNEQSILQAPHVRIKKLDVGQGFVYRKGEVTQTMFVLAQGSKEV